jgi:ketosteroid isomerase-like protein
VARSGSCSKYFADYDAHAKQNGITDGIFGIRKARHIDVTGDHAYVVVPAWYKYKQDGKPKKEEGTSVIVLQKGKDGWRITSWSWARQ